MGSDGDVACMAVMMKGRRSGVQYAQHGASEPAGSYVKAMGARVTVQSQDESVECGVNVVFDLIGSKWKPTILWRLGEGDRRFAELRRAVGAISEKVLTAQLRELERDGLVTRTAHVGFPLRVEYALTEQGAELNAALDAVASWGDRYAAAARGSS